MINQENLSIGAQAAKESQIVLKLSGMKQSGAITISEVHTTIAIYVKTLEKNCHLHWSTSPLFLQKKPFDSISYILKGNKHGHLLLIFAILLAILYKKLSFLYKRSHYQIDGKYYVRNERGYVQSS